MTTEEIKRLIRKMLVAEIRRNMTAFIIREEAALQKNEPLKLKDNSKPDLVGDAIEDIDLNLYFDDTGPDEKISAAVAVKAGAEKEETGVTAGQRKAKFDSK